MIAFVWATVMECTRGSLTKLLFIKAVTTPIFDNPNQIATYSGRFSITNDIVSPFLKPSFLK